MTGAMPDQHPGVLVYSTRLCPYCMMARRLLNAKGVDFEEIRIDQDRAQAPVMMQRSGRRTVPQIFIGEQHIGGYDELAALEHNGRLDALLEGVKGSSD